MVHFPSKLQIFPGNEDYQIPHFFHACIGLHDLLIVMTRHVINFNLIIHWNFPMLNYYYY